MKMNSFFNLTKPDKSYERMDADAFFWFWLFFFFVCACFLSFIVLMLLTKIYTKKWTLSMSQKCHLKFVSNHAILHKWAKVHQLATKYRMCVWNLEIVHKLSLKFLTIF